MRVHLVDAFDLSWDSHVGAQRCQTNVYHPREDWEKAWQPRDVYVQEGWKPREKQEEERQPREEQERERQAREEREPERERQPLKGAGGGAADAGGSGTGEGAAATGGRKSELKCLPSVDHALAMTEHKMYK